MAAKAVHERRYARERAVELLYEMEQRGATLDEILAELPLEPEEYALALVRGAEAARDDVEATIAERAEGWALDRMPLLDRVVLRLGIEELRNQPDVPTAVVISEAVELATQYSTDNSGRFVNGILARIADDIRRN